MRACEAGPLSYRAAVMVPKEPMSTGAEIIRKHVNNVTLLKELTEWCHLTVRAGRNDQVQMAVTFPPGSAQ